MFLIWWDAARPTKTVVFWSWVASIILTMIIGFAWGGWVTGGTAQKMAEVMVENAVVQRLAPICVVQFNQDPGKDQKPKELQEAQSYQRDDYVKDQVETGQRAQAQAAVWQEVLEKGKHSAAEAIL